MDDQLTLRVGNGVENIEEQHQAPRQGQRPRLTVPIDRLPLDVFEDEVRLPAFAHPGIKKARDVSVGQPGQEICLVTDLSNRQRTEAATLEQLNRHLALELFIAPTPKPNAAHTAAAQQPHDRVRTNVRSDQDIVGR